MERSIGAWGAKVAVVPNGGVESPKGGAGAGLGGANPRGPPRPPASPPSRDPLLYPKSLFPLPAAAPELLLLYGAVPALDATAEVVELVDDDERAWAGA